MKKLIIALAIVLLPVICTAGDHVNVPWEEFKELYKKSIEADVLGKKDPDPFIFSIDSGSYQMNLAPEGGKGHLALEGIAISGDPEPIPLFSKDMIINEIINVSGGSLLCGLENNQGIVFFPNNKEHFKVEISFYVPAREDTQSDFISIKIPKALKNRLALHLSKDLMLLEAPGIKDVSGVYNFSAQSSMDLRFTDKKKKKPQIKDLTGQFKNAITPPTVLDSVSYFTSFEENGNILSVLVMDVPNHAGGYLKIDALPDTGIWSLKVNNKNMKVYLGGDNEDKWIIPLAKNKTSSVELAMIRHGEKLGLNGRLETVLPGMELASKHVSVAIALPRRVQLISYEGPLTPSPEININPPKEFIGKPYYFSRAFHRGQGMNIAVMYKEPAK